MGTIRSRVTAALAALLISAGAGAFFASAPAYGSGGSDNPNNTGYWENQYAAHDAVCYKYGDSTSPNAHGGIVQDGDGKWSGVQLNAYQASWPGDHWEVLIVNGGPNGDAVYEHPSAGTTYSTPGENAQGKKYDVSHLIVCKGTTPPVDVCANIDGSQETVPDGMIREGDNCVTPPPPPVNYCDVSEKPGGVSVAAWLENNGIDPATCFNYEPVQQCGAFDMSITQSPVGISYGFQYAVGADQDTVYPGLDFPATFDEDEGGGSVQITVWMVGGESDYVRGTDIPNLWDNNGQTFTVNTDCAPPPPVVEQCPTYSSVHTTDLATWDLSETRATGHNELVEGALKVWTEGATSTDKAAGYYATDFPLKNLGTETIAQMLDYTADFGIAPGLQLVVDFDNNGTPDSILVGEAVYGNSWWAANSSAQFVKDGSPNTGGGYGSSWYGTANEWLGAFPDARVKAIGYSVGSGVHASGAINQITIGCTEYTFGTPVLVETTPAKPTWVDPCGLDNGNWEYTDTDEYYYEVTENKNGSQTIKVYAKDGYVFPDGAKTQWTKKDSGELCPVEDPKVEYTTWVDEKWACDDTTTTQTRTKTTTTYVWDEDTPGYVVDTVNKTEESRERDLTEQEIFACPDDGNDVGTPKNDWLPAEQNPGAPWGLWAMAGLVAAAVGVGGGALFATRRRSEG